jgi:hypothetical protein
VRPKAKTTARRRTPRLKRRKEAALPPGALVPPVLLTRESIQNVIRNTFSDWVPAEQLRFLSVVSDNVYVGADLVWLMGMILHDPVLAPTAYQQEIFDCDDYAFYVKTRASLHAENNSLAAPLAVGVLLTDAHAFNIGIAVDGTVTIVNTQSTDHGTISTPSAFGQFLSLGPANSIRLIYL